MLNFSQGYLKPAKYANYKYLSQCEALAATIAARACIN